VFEGGVVAGGRGWRRSRLGKRLMEVGVSSREQFEALLGTPVFLDLHVKVAKDWQRDPKQLRRLGF
ncbi:hypothetical protein ACWDRW_16755, partial [Streptomyces sp. NPDC003635]